MYDTENVKSKFSRLRRPFKDEIFGIHFFLTTYWKWPPATPPPPLLSHLAESSFVAKFQPARVKADFLSSQKLLAAQGSVAGEVQRARFSEHWNAAVFLKRPSIAMI